MVMEAWLRFLDSGQISLRAIDKAWHRCYHDVTNDIKANPNKCWDNITSAMSATIMHLLQLRITPSGSSLWHREGDDGSQGTPIPMNMGNTMDRAHHLQWIRQRLAAHMWHTISPHPANGGIWDGELADFHRTKAIHHKLLSQGKVEEANALRAVVTHNVWYAHRATTDEARRT